MSEYHDKRAVEILRKIRYATIATVSKDGKLTLQAQPTVITKIQKTDASFIFSYTLSNHLPWRHY